MSCIRQHVRNAGTFKGNLLGQQRASAPPRRRVAALPSDTAPAQAPFCDPQYFKPQPAAFEATTLAQFLGNYTDPFTYNVRVLRTSDGPGGVFSIGTALSTTTGAVEGFLMRTVTADGCEQSTSVAVVLSFTDPATGAVYALTQPKALLVTRESVIVVGHGYMNDVEFGPAVAVVNNDPVCPSKMPSPFVVVGNADDLPGEVYNDIAVNPFCDGCWLVAATATIDDVETALVRCIDAVTLLPRMVGPVLAPTLYTPITPPAAIEGQPTSGVSVTATSSLVVVGVHVDGGVNSLLWTLRPDLTEVLPWTATGYNDPVSGVLVSPLATDGITLIRALALPDDSLFVAVLSGLDTAANLPAAALQVMLFTADTTPAVWYGDSGIVTWYDAGANATRPNDAVLTRAPSGSMSLLVTGNTFAQQVAPTEDTSLYNVPGFPYLNVVVPDFYVPPKPFLVEFPLCPVTPRVLVLGLPGCARVHWASSTATTPPSFTLVGDTAFKTGCPNQNADLLIVLVAALCGRGVVPSPARIVNCQPVPVPVLTSSCDGFINISGLCTRTTVLKVAGPVIVGCYADNEMPLPGMIRFDPLSRQFLGYNGTEWTALTAPPT